MAGPLWFDRVRETSGTSGVGPITPSGAVAGGFKTIGSVLAASDTAYFVVSDGSGNWNVFLGTWNGTTVTRTTIYSGSSGTSAVNLTGVGVEIGISVPATWLTERANLPAAGIVSSDGALLSAVSLGLGLFFDPATGEFNTALNTSTFTASFTPDINSRGNLCIFAGSAASTVTLDATGLDVGWYIVLQHEGTGTTGDTKRLDIVGTLDGVTDPAVYPGDTRIIYYDGAFKSVLLKGGYIELLNADSPFTLTLPTGRATHEAEVWGGGGSGGSGRRGAAAGIRAGGSAGGGGSYNRLVLSTADIGATSVTVTIGAATTGGAAITADTTNGANGTVGNNTTFGTILTGYGGGAGFGGAAANNTGGSGAGTTAVGNAGSSGASSGGGSPTASVQGSFQGGGGAVGINGLPGGWGGGAGGATASTGSGTNGGSAAYGGRGGGGGGSLDAANVARAGGTGGSATGSNGGGGAGGAATGVAGTAGTAGPTPMGPGTGGGGGGAGATTGGNGAAGGIACGGGGGAASLNGNNSGAGGGGGAGLCRYRYSP